MHHLTRHATIIAILVGLILSGCQEYDIRGFFTSPSATVDKRFEQSLSINDSLTADTLITVGTDTYLITAISDIHITATAHNLAQYIDMAETNDSIAAALILGDITDAKGGHLIAADTIDAIGPTTPIRAVVGNHDLFFNQWETYKHYFGSSSYYFVVQTPDTADLFICLDSGSGTLGRRQTDWLIDLLNSRRHLYRHCIVATHTNFFDTDFSQTPSGTFHIDELAQLTALFAKLRVGMVLNGHDHHYETHSYNNTLYITAGPSGDDVIDAAYLILTVNDTITHRRKRVKSEE